MTNYNIDLLIFFKSAEIDLKAKPVCKDDKDGYG
jgi:hypothetical protein